LSYRAVEQTASMASTSKSTFPASSESTNSVSGSKGTQVYAPLHSGSTHGQKRSRESSPTSWRDIIRS